jgi:hypothetical protein
MWIIQRPAGLKMYKYETSPDPVLKANQNQEIPKRASPKSCSGSRNKPIVAHRIHIPLCHQLQLALPPAAGNLRAQDIIVSERLKEASMRIRKITITAQTSFALGFGLAAAVLFWWEASEPIWSSSWTGSAEQWLAVACVAIGLCATLVAFGGVLSAVSKTPRRDD